VNSELHDYLLLFDSGLGDGQRRRQRRRAWVVLGGLDPNRFDVQAFFHLLDAGSAVPTSIMATDEESILALAIGMRGIDKGIARSEGRTPMQPHRLNAYELAPAGMNVPRGVEAGPALQPPG
jgi:hypothetical protein